MSIKNKIKAGIVGASGYTGGELLRLLVNHAVSYTHPTLPTIRMV